MLFGVPGKPTKIKKIIYLFASTILGLVLSFIAHALIEINYLSWAAKYGYIVASYGSCFLPFWFQNILWALGAVGGFLLGKFWWRKLYVERVWMKRKKRK